MLDFFTNLNALETISDKCPNMWENMRKVLVSEKKDLGYNTDTDIRPWCRALVWVQ